MKKDEIAPTRLSEATLSAALVRDITSRHFFAENGTVVKPDVVCGNCEKSLSKGTMAIFVKNFERKKRIAICSAGCLDAHEHAEMLMIGCDDLKNIPCIRGKRNVMNHADLLYVYEERLAVYRQNCIDKAEEMHKIRHDSTRKFDDE